MDELPEEVLHIIGLAIPEHQSCRCAAIEEDFVACQSCLNAAVAVVVDLRQSGYRIVPAG